MHRSFPDLHLQQAALSCGLYRARLACMTQQAIVLGWIQGILEPAPGPVVVLGIHLCGAHSLAAKIYSLEINVLVSGDVLKQLSGPDSVKLLNASHERWLICWQSHSAPLLGCCEMASEACICMAGGILAIRAVETFNAGPKCVAFALMLVDCVCVLEQVSFWQIFYPKPSITHYSSCHFIFHDSPEWAPMGTEGEPPPTDMAPRKPCCLPPLQYVAWHPEGWVSPHTMAS